MDFMFTWKSTTGHRYGKFKLLYRNSYETVSRNIWVLQTLSLTSVDHIDVIENAGHVPKKFRERQNFRQFHIFKKDFTNYDMKTCATQTAEMKLLGPFRKFFPDADRKNSQPHIWHSAISSIRDTFFNLVITITVCATDFSAMCKQLSRFSVCSRHCKMHRKMTCLNLYVKASDKMGSKRDGKLIKWIRSSQIMIIDRILGVSARLRQ